MNDSYSTALHEHQLGNLDLAEELYHLALKGDPKNCEVLHLLGILRSQRQDYLNAHYFIERALVIDQDSATLHNSMGNVLQKLGQHERAISHYATALNLEPNNASVHNNLGNIFYQLDKISEAKKHYSEAIRLRPGYVDAYYNLSLVLIKQDLASEAMGHLESVINLSPQHGLAHSNLAYLLQLQGDYDRAMQYYQRALDILGDSVLSHHNLGVIFTKRGKNDEAIYHFKKVLDLQPDHLEALHNLGSIFLLQRKPKEALPFFLQLAQISKDFDTYYNLGVIYLDMALFEEAAGYFNKSLKISPNDFSTNLNLGAIYLQLRDFVQAEHYYLKSSHLQPDNEEVRYILAAIQQNGSSQKAPLIYVQHLFDQYAPYFDKHLEILDHQAPQVLFDAVCKELGEEGQSLMILDLGCGTGLAGDKFKSISKTIVGIDISEGMLDKARNKGIYTDLKLGSIEDLLPMFSNVGLILAADSLVYFGDLESVFAKCRHALDFGGIFAFTIESTDLYPFVLQRSARFAHSDKYIKEIAMLNDFILLQSSSIHLRKQDDSYIDGYLFVLRRG